MLKIKDNVDLEKLKKFGFKPKYNSDTGDILYYYRDYFTRHKYDNEYCRYQIIIYKEKIKIEHCGCSFKKKFIKTNFVYDEPPIYSNGFDMFVDLLFDLIQAGLVEKVGEKND